MLTDKSPRKAEFKDEFYRSEAMETFKLPAEEPLRKLAAQLEDAMKREDKKQIQKICSEIAALICQGFGAPPPAVKVLGARPLEVRGDMVDETYGDYTFETQRIRLWMRTAVHEKMTSFGTLLSTLCHEVCHHLDVVHFSMPNTFHTRGFYERSGLLYHHVRGTPKRQLVWDQLNNGTFRINWPKTMKAPAIPLASQVSDRTR